MRLRTGRNFFHSTTHLCSIPRRTLNLSTDAFPFIPFLVVLERTHNESLREKCLFSVATLRPAPVEGRLTNNCTVPASRLYTLRQQTGTSSDTSVSRDLRKLTDVSRILEQNHVVGIETHGSRKLVFRKQVLGEEDDADVSVVRSLRKHVGDRLIGLRLRNDLYCVEWGVKLYSFIHSHWSPA